ncbi:tetratricopeptide repeat protein [Gracilimonas mengyeensis]|uniref:Tetratricopeptide repeat-containing protein n=1 Tax=Gracilimonas mengyeensis TaxID=1302730 RepID=A0A521FFH2_9BACT|nr:tetratricopeptide repeat protein [Gracilimonas mengyeensis]SMO94933.1 Tetratricopeptide repeat-containing protein [Gracilimonas mengyeensis]
MKHHLSKLLAAFLIVGVLASCESSDPLISEAQKNIYTQNYDEAIAMLDSSIATNPNSGLPYYYKALAYSEKALSFDDPAERKPPYKNFRESIVTARELFAGMEETPDVAGDVNNLILNTWGVEHNAAIEYATDDSVAATVEQPLKLAINHLENAIIVNPDSTLSYDVLSQVYYMDNNLQGAANALNQSMDLKNPPPAADYERLSAYYANLNKVDSSVVVLEEGMEIYPDSVSLVQRLADSYMQAGDRDRSIELIQTLIETDPSNPQYRLALGTQLLQATSEISEQVSDNYDRIYELQQEARGASGQAKEALNEEIAELETETAALEAEIAELSTLAEEELTEVIELRPNDDTAYNALGIIYQNKSAALFDKRNFTTDNQKAAEYDEMAKEELTKAMEYYEQAAELDPDNTQYWQTLSRIYVTLDMPEKAQEAMEKAGM